MKRTTILLGDDHSLVLEGIRKLLENHYDVVGTATDGKALVEKALELKPDIVVLDISMPILNGIDAAREIRKASRRARLVFVSMHANALYLRKAIEAGASAYVLKSGASEEILYGVEAARRNGTYFSPGLSREVIEIARKEPRVPARSPIELTARQRHILQLIAEGKQNKEISGILNVSVRTVEFHRSRLMARLNVRTVAELTRLAIQEGLISSTE